MTADYIKRLRSKPTLEDDYSSLIKVLRECGFTKCPSSGAPLDNLQCLSEEAKELWMQSRYYDWFLLEQPVGSSDFETALRQYERARQELTAQLTADHACVKDGLDLIDLDANGITVISSSGSSGSSDHTCTHTQSGEALTISYSDAEMRDGEATDAMCEFNKNVAEQKDCSLEDVVYTSEPMPLSAQAAAVIDSALSGEGIDSDGVRLETQRGRGKKLIVDGVFGQGFEEYGLTQADGGTVAERNKAQRDNTLRLLPSCFEAMQKKRSTLATQGIDVFDSYFDFKTLYSERPGAALVLAYVYLAEESQKLAGGGKYGDSHCVNTANPNAEFGWHPDNHLQLDGGQYLETSVIWQCSNGRASVKVAGFGELTYPGVGGVVTFPAWALHRSGIVDPETPERMWKLAFFFEPSLDDSDLSHQGASSATHVVCIKVPKNGEEKAEYDKCRDREEWMRHVVGPYGEYVSRPCTMGGWFASPTVKAGSMFANPYPTGDGDGQYTPEESMRLFRVDVRHRMSPSATKEQVEELLPTTGAVGHLQLDVVGNEFRSKLCALGGKTLGCWCDPKGLCHAKVLAEEADALRAIGPPSEYPYPNEAWTTTWGDMAMNEVKMQKIGM